MTVYYFWFLLDLGFLLKLHTTQTHTDRVNTSLLVLTNNIQVPSQVTTLAQFVFRFLSLLAIFKVGGRPRLNGLHTTDWILGVCVRAIIEKSSSLKILRP